MQRPTGVTVISILAFIAAGFLVIGAIGMFLGGAIMSGMAERPGVGMIAGVGGALFGVILLCLAALWVVIGINLLNLKNWARLLTIVLVGIALLLAIPGFLLGLRHIGAPFVVGALIVRFVAAVFQVWVVVYLLKPHVKQAFSGSSPAVT